MTREPNIPVPHPQPSAVILYGEPDRNQIPWSYWTVFQSIKQRDPRYWDLGQMTSASSQQDHISLKNIPEVLKWAFFMCIVVFFLHEGVGSTETGITDSC